MINISKNVTNETIAPATANVLKAGVPTKRITSTTLKPVAASDLEGAHDPIEYLIDGYMQRGTFNSIIGPSKSGKSMFALQMSFCVQNGIDFLGCKTDKSKVLYVDFELKPNLILQRLNSVKSFYSMPNGEEPLFFSVYDDFSAGRINFDSIMNSVRNAVSRDPEIRLVIFDCFYTWCKGARNQEGNVTAHLLPLKTLAADYDISVCYVHHTTKGGIPKDPCTNDIINAAGGSGVHGKIIDTTYVIYPEHKSEYFFNVATAGRVCQKDTKLCERTNETYHCFFEIDGEAQEVIDVDRTLCKRILDYIERTDCTDERQIKEKFKVSKEALRDMGFGIDTKTHKIFFDKKALLLPQVTEDAKNEHISNDSEGTGEVYEDEVA